MRRALLPSLLALLLLGASAGGAAAEFDHEEEITIEGIVTGPDGAPASDAVVLVGDSGTLTGFSPAELRALAAENPENLTVVGTDSDGRFETSLGSLQAEAAVAVSDAGVSDLLWIRGENATLDVQLYEHRPQTVHAHIGAVTHDQRRDELLVSLVNSGDTAIGNLTFGVVSVPEGWSVTGAETNGTYHSDSRTVTWRSVAPGEEIDATVVLSVPENASPGEYTVELRAGSDTHRVDVESETVEVLPENTPGPTTTPPPGGNGTPAGDDETPTTEGDDRTPTPTGSTTDPTNPTTTGGSGPGLGIGAATAALVLLAALLVRRR